MRYAVVTVMGLAVGLTVAGCSVSSGVDAYERSDRLAIAKDQYVVQKQQCEQMGGSMSMRTRPLQPPGLTEYRSATCVRR